MLYPNIQIFDFVPKIQVWDVNTKYINLFWFPLKQTEARFYKIYWASDYNGPFSLLKTIPNARTKGRNTSGPYAPNSIFVSISKEELGLGDVTYYFKVSVVAPDGTETSLSDIPTKPVFTIEEHRQKGRFYGRSGQVHLAYTLTIPAHTSYGDNILDVLYILGRVGSATYITVDQSEINVKVNSVTGLPIYVKDEEELEFPKNDMDIIKIFFENTTDQDAIIRVLVSG